MTENQEDALDMEGREITPEEKADQFIEWFNEWAVTERDRDLAPLFAGKLAYEIGNTHPWWVKGESNFKANFYAKVERICKDKLKHRQ